MYKQIYSNYFSAFITFIVNFTHERGDKMKQLIITITLLAMYPTNAAEPLIIDHHSSSQFENIPQEFIDKAINLRMMFRHASVGWAIENGLECLQGTKSKCKDYPKYKYDRRAWKFIPEEIQAGMAR
jgi:hypothetical protein